MQKTSIKNYDTITEILNNNGVVIIPTDTIYGIATNLNNASKIIELKKRNDKPLAILCATVEEMTQIITIDKQYLPIITKYLPGALTVVGKTKNPKYAINPGINTTGVRIPNHQSLLNLLKITGPLIVSSANISGQAETYTIAQAYAYFKESVDLYVENDQHLTMEASAVIGLDPFIIYRDGKLASQIKTEIENTL